MNAFIQEISGAAKTAGKKYNVLPSLIIAQAIHESNWGKSGLAVKGKNLFGVKGYFEGQCVTMPTWEEVNGKRKNIKAAFRKYPSWLESITDLMNLYMNGVSWDRKKYHKVIGEKDYRKACKAVQSAGYATDSKYADKLIKTIEANKLYQFDNVPSKTVQNASGKAILLSGSFSNLKQSSAFLIDLTTSYKPSDSYIVQDGIHFKVRAEFENQERAKKVLIRLKELNKLKIGYIL